MNKQGIGAVRPSQVITTFGPGAIVDLKTLSVIVAGIDRWPIAGANEIRLMRLERALKVERFFAAQPHNGNDQEPGTVPAFIFPRYQHCPTCKTLSEIGDGYVRYDALRQAVLCDKTECGGSKGEKKRHVATVPAPFIVACPAGHMDDFPWRNYAHSGPTECRKRMSLEHHGRTSTIADIFVRCECEKKRSVAEAFGERSKEFLGLCSRRKPWLGQRFFDERCSDSKDVRAMQRGATNVWFPILSTALAVAEDVTKIGEAVAKIAKHQVDNIQSKSSLERYVADRMFPSLEGMNLGEVWSEIEKSRSTVQADENELRWPEWVALRKARKEVSGPPDLRLEIGEVPKEFDRLLRSVVRVHALREVRALTGFSRIEPYYNDSVSKRLSRTADIAHSKLSWLPAVEVRGEGILVELEESAVQAWEAQATVKQRTAPMAKAFAFRFGTVPFPGARYVLLHSLAHALIRQLALDCGYSSASVRERIYCSASEPGPMAGVLLYTASADSEGSLGGLVDLGAREHFADLMHGALDSSRGCSSDPLCADHQADGHGHVNAAACHSCLLASETSCEVFNRLLDRNFLVPTAASGDCAFFSTAL